MLDHFVGFENLTPVIFSQEIAGGLILIALLHGASENTKILLKVLINSNLQAKLTKPFKIVIFMFPKHWDK